MQLFSIEGINLKNVFFEDKKCILTILTQEEGLMHFMIQGLSQKKSHLFALISPLNRVQLTYCCSNADWHYIKDGVILDEYTPLKASWDFLALSGLLCKTLCDTLLPKGKNPKIYLLLHGLLQNLSQSSYPSSLASHFLFKILSWEGLADLANICRCNTPSFGMQRGESLCSSCKNPSFPWDFLGDEWLKILELFQSTSFSRLGKIPSDEAFFKKNLRYFYERMEKSPFEEMRKGGLEPPWVKPVTTSR
jgi:DNA repair protein RecO